MHPSDPRLTWSVPKLLAEIDRLEEEATEHHILLGWQRKAQVEADAYWQKRTGASGLEFPGLHRLLRFLLDEITLYRAHLNDVLDESERVLLREQQRDPAGLPHLQRAIERARKFMTEPRER